MVWAYESTGWKQLKMYSLFLPAVLSYPKCSHWRYMCEHFGWDVLTTSVNHIREWAPVRDPPLRNKTTNENESKMSDDLITSGALLCCWVYIYEGEWLGCFIWQFIFGCQSLGDKARSKHMELTGEGFGLLSSLLCFELQIIECLQKHKQARKYGFSN